MPYQFFDQNQGEYDAMKKSPTETPTEYIDCERFTLELLEEDSVLKNDVKWNTWIYLFI